MNDIIYTDDMNRPKIGRTGIDLHKVVIQIRNGKTPTKIVDEYYATCGYLEDRIEGLDPQEIHSRSDEDFPALTVKMVQECLEFTSKNEEFIDSIIREDKILKQAIFGGKMDAKSVEERITAVDLEYFQIEFERNGDNYSLNWNN